MVGDFSYGVNANLAVNKNKITRIANSEGVIEGTNPGFGMVSHRFIVHKLDIRSVIFMD